MNVKCWIFASSDKACCPRIYLCTGSCKRHLRYLVSPTRGKSPPLPKHTLGFFRIIPQVKTVFSSCLVVLWLQTWKILPEKASGSSSSCSQLLFSVCWAILNSRANTVNNFHLLPLSIPPPLQISCISPNVPLPVFFSCCSFLISNCKNCHENLVQQ